MKAIFILPAAILFLFFACENKEKKQENNQEPVAKGDLVEKDSLVTSITKISDSEYITPDGDTILLEKPFFFTFEGEIDGKKVQAYVNKCMASESYGYGVYGHIYVEGDSSTVGFGLEQSAPGKWKTPKDEWYQNQDYQYEFSSSGTFVVLKGGTRYPLTASEVQYQAYDVFDYRMNYCYSEGSLEYKSHWEYDFQAVPQKYPEKYASFFKKNPLSQLETSHYSSNYKSWKNNVELEIKAGNQEEGEDCYMTFSQGSLNPLYLDSTVFVISYFSHIYLGGAHGVPSTTYFNFDVKTGKLLHLKDIVRMDDERFITFYIDHLKEACKDEDGEVQFLQEPTGATENFFLLPTGITFSYFPYELMGFAAGEPELFLSWEDLKSFLVREVF